MCLIEPMHEGSFTTQPPILGGSNYAYWKARMIAFLKSIDSKSWKFVVIGGNTPIVTDTTSKVYQKPEISWSSVEDETCSFGNSCALNPIFNGVDQN